MEKLISNFIIATGAISNNKIRSFLTALGILFGVAAVISMMAIGKGAKEELVEQLKFIGASNIVINSTVKEKTEGQEDDEGEEQKVLSDGLSLSDLSAIEKSVPNISMSTAEIISDSRVYSGGLVNDVKLIGIMNESLNLSNLKIEKGNNFANLHHRDAMPVCIIGKTLGKKYFIDRDAIGEYIKVDDQWLQIIGVLEEKPISQKVRTNLGIRNYNMDVYIPVSTMLVRYKNKGVNKPEIRGRSGQEQNDYHQINRIVLQIDDDSELTATANVVAKLLKRRHNNQTDFEVKIPVHLIEQQQKTRDIFNIVLSAIAGISLLVGGIGIMNIMLASVMERTREIGIRLAVGAKKEDIITQFMFEAILISLFGGIAGVLLGIVSSYFVETISGIKTIISAFAVLLSFGVSVVIGLIFGISPARKAANLNPIESLRYE